MSFLLDLYEWWIAPFASTSNREILAVSLLVTICTSVVGTWVVLKGMSFLGDALSHGVLPGIALSVLLGVNPIFGAVLAALLMVAGIGFIRERSPLPEDTSIGIMFVGFLALAVVITSSNSGAGNLEQFLFGAILAANKTDLYYQLGITLAVVVGVAIFYRTLLVMTFDETQAKLLGLRPRLGHQVLLVLIVTAVVSNFEKVGSLLVIAFLVAPPATAALFIKKVPFIIIGASVLGCLSVFIGFLLSYHYGLAPSATMALVTVSCFLLGVSLKSFGDFTSRKISSSI